MELCNTSEMHKQIQAAARELTDTVIRPSTQMLDLTGGFPRLWFQECGRKGLLGAEFPTKYGGLDLDAVATTSILEELAKGSGSLAAALAAHIQCARFLLCAGSEEQRQKYLVPALQGTLLLSFSMTEASGGSDVLQVYTSAERAGDSWVLNGAKHWISNGGEAQAYVLTARTNSERSRRSISLFLVEQDAPGLIVTPIEHKMGMNNLSVGDLTLQNCRIPDRCLVGGENQGYDLSIAALCDSRLYHSAVAVGLAEGALELALDYVRKREQYGRPIRSNQGVSFPLADMYTQIQAARAFLYQMAQAREDPNLRKSDVAALKLFATEMCCKVCDQAMQLLGGNGYSQDYQVERYVRDSRMLRLASGTSEICRVIVSNHLI